MSQEELSHLLTEYIMMSSYGPRVYTDEQSISYFSKMSSNTLTGMLKLCEDLEEYEFCAYIFQALKLKTVYSLVNQPSFSPMAIID
ncbi:hypothetical protein [Daejeonella oryzae]|uniref:hypothetical protein n=1 Tax=Daejeonella oryzae TaxID=1122943 RepID=UPI0003FCE1E2|nr:hypothetical protein [Daejeonella oryzae]